MSDLDLGSIGERISKRRRSLGMTQEQLAEEMEVSVQMISNLERGVKAIRIDNLVKLSRILNATTDYILTGEQARAANSSLPEQVARLSEENSRLVEVLVSYLLHEQK